MSSLGSLIVWLNAMNAVVTLDGRSIPPENLTPENCRRVANLDVAGRGLSAIPDEISQFSGLHSLNLSRNNLEIFPHGVLQLKNLRELQISRNMVRDLPPELGNLTALEGLYASRNLVSEIPVSISRLRRLRVLNVRNNRLTSLPASIFSLRDLVELDVSENSITALPEGLSKLSKIRNLYVSGNDLSSLPEEIGSLSSLESLAISGNRLTELPETICRLRDLKSFWVYDNPLSVPPAEVANGGLADIRAFFYAQAGGVKELERLARVLVVGPPRAGKTSLVERITKGSFSPRRRETNGINISRWRKHGGDRRIIFWDFGGQRYMHAAHRLFISSGTIFTLVLEVSNVDSIEYWLQLISGLSRSSQVLVVVNKVDQPINNDLDRRMLRNKYPIIKGFHLTSCKSEYGISQFIEALADVAATQAMGGRTVPISWALVHDALGREDVPALTMDEFRTLCRSRGCEDSDEQQALIRFLDTIGSAVILDRLSIPRVVRDPQWLVNGIYLVITSTTAREAGGFLPEAVASSLLENESYGTADRSLILEVLKKYDYCLVLDNGMLLVPDLLPSVIPRDLEIPDTGTVRHTVRVDGDASFLEARVLARLAQDVAIPMAWRHGAVLHSTAVDASAVLVADQHDRQIRIVCWGTDRITYLGYIRLAIRSIASLFGDVEISELIPIPGIDYSIDYDEAIGQYLMGEDEVCIGKLGIRKNLRALLFGVNGSGGRLLMSGPVFNFDRSAVSFGTGGAINVNMAEVKSLAAKLVEELRTSQLAGSQSLSEELSEAALSEDAARLKALAERAAQLGADVAPVTDVADSMVTLLS
ncbi:COR domain-containing protein [Streptomyces sp. BK205]|uniref:COR domain-containing protein n=1 Tax=Streptomyces sp. BK205 TaxID=2512164 RepID=UPI0010479C84|nr:COR domain-containing protein [Streptomyces sp. BK205]TCR24002.1 hypothetical protein EV578_103324 [Streptomyces sp. BK205]